MSPIKSRTGRSKRRARNSASTTNFRQLPMRLNPKRSLLLAGASLAALALTAPAVYAKPLGSGPAPTPTAAAIAAAQSNSAEAQRAAQASRDALQRATAAIQAMQSTQLAAQQAAREAARIAAQQGLTAPSGIPDGLKPGGLDPIIAADSWIGAGAPTATKDGYRTKVDIQQTQQRAIMTWTTFNVSENTDVNFNQQSASWVALNRVLDPHANPSDIRGSINAPGTVLIINQNGILFGAGAQINVGSLIASTLDVGPTKFPDPTSSSGALTTATVGMRNQNFLQNGLLGYQSTVDAAVTNEYSAPFTPLTSGPQGDVIVAKGASIAAGAEGLILLTAPHVINAGALSAPQGQVILTAAEIALTLTPSSGAGSDPIPHSVKQPGFDGGGGNVWAASDKNIRGFVPLPQGQRERSDYYVWNQASGLIEAPQGNIYLRSPGRTIAQNTNGYYYDNAGGITIGFGAARNDGVLSSTTSVSRNGSIFMDAGDVRLGAGSVISILPDPGGETIPQSPDSLAGFRPSAIRIGRNANSIVMEENSFLLAPGGDVLFGRTDTVDPQAFPSILIKTGAVINVAGLTNVLVPITENEVLIDPAKKNELRDSPLYRSSFLNGAKIYLDPRISGVRDDGTPWIGSPLIDAKAYYQLVGVGAERMMIKGGSVTLGVGMPLGDPNRVHPSSVVVRQGATIDISGGWVNYESGTVRSTQLIDKAGHIVDIANADPNGVYVGIYNGWVRNHEHWGVLESWTNPLGRFGGGHYQPGYSEGRDAGIMQVTAPALVLDNTFFGWAHPGEKQVVAGKAGTGKSTFSGDDRAVQAANSELPAGGALIFKPSSSVRITTELPPAPEGVDSNWVGGGISDSGVYTRPTLSTTLPLPASRIDEILLTDKQLSGAGLSEVAILATVELPSSSVASFPATRLAYGEITVEAGTNIVLNPGGIFRAEGSHIQIDGNITAPSGKITLRTDYGARVYDRNNPRPPNDPGVPGDHDIVINGSLSVAGRWVNDFGAPDDQMLGPGWLNGGTISMEAASLSGGWMLGVGGRPFLYDANGQLISPAPTSETNKTAVDLNGSILINPGARLNLSGGGRIDQKGKFDLTAKGGNLTLKSASQYYRDLLVGGSGLRLVSVVFGGFDDVMVLPINPDSIKSRIVFGRDSIEAHGFGGGGTFTLLTPEISLGDGTPTTGTILPFDFFSTSGFANYNITSYKTEFTPSTFTNGYGGYNALLATQTLTVGAGQTLSLFQSVLPDLNHIDAGQRGALFDLASGGDIHSIVKASVPTNAWDQKAVNLNLGGMIELHIAEGGKVVGAAGSSLTVGGLINEGTIRIAGGTITQRWELPAGYITGLTDTAWRDPIGFRSFSDIFSVNPDGTIDLTAASKYKDGSGNPISNQDLVGDFITDHAPTTGRAVYKLGLLDQGQGIVLGAHSVTDLSGAIITNPYLTPGQAAASGRIVGGGTLAALPPQWNGGYVYNLPYYRAGGSITGSAGAVIDLSGVAGTLNLPSANGYAPTAVWSNGGTLFVGAGAALAGIDIRAQGGNAQAQGGTLQFVQPVFTQHDPATPTMNVVSADMITRSGFDSFIAYGSITSSGDATVTLDRAFFLAPQPWKYTDGVSSTADRQSILSPTISTGGALVIDAPYIGLQNIVDVLVPATGGTPTGTVTFNGRQIDLTGAIRFDKSVTSATLHATGDIRLIGVDNGAWQRLFSSSVLIDNPTLKGALAVNGDLSLIAAQIYPTTGSTFNITSSAADGTITIGRSSSETPSVPYSAGGNLLIQARHIEQGGVIRVPFGTLTLGSNASKTAEGSAFVIAPATDSVLLSDGSITSVSAGGLSIPYGITTDTIEWYFAPTSAVALSGPPVKVMSLNGKNITLAAGATVDLTGGGDVYAYEFVPGTGGSRDVLSQFNGDKYSANMINGVGYQYPDGRQIYAIVPGLSDAPVAAYDPIYSANYGNLSSTSGVGQRVYLAGGNGLAAGWYTLLPAQYAMLPGGMRVVEQTGATNVVPGASVQLGDGSLLVSGRYGDALTGASDYQTRQFSVMSQTVINSYSKIVLTSGNDMTLSKAEAQGLVAPRTGLDSARLALNPLNTLTVNATVLGAAAKGGRGSQVDIGGSQIEITSTAADAATPGAIHLTVDSLNNLKAESLLIGGTRVDNTDGTTNLAITASSIVLANDKDHALVGPEIVFVVDDGVTNPVGSRLTLNDGATVIATGTVNDQRSGAYIVDGRVIVTNGTGNLDDNANTGGNQTYHLPVNSAVGALLRVANGPQRVVQRLRTVADPEIPGSTGTPTGPDAALTIGNVSLQGNTIGFDTSHAVSVGSNASFQGKDIALGAAALAFTTTAQPSNVVVITPELQALLSQGDQLTLRSQSFIGFDNGQYKFKSVVFDAATLRSLQGGSVTLDAGSIQFSNAGTAGVASGGTGTLAANADQIGFGSGVVATTGFGGGVSLTARQGIYSGRTPVNATIAPPRRFASTPVAPPSTKGIFDIGAASLTIVTPFIGDRGTVGVITEPAANMTLRTSGNVSISNAGTTPVDLKPYPGIPGSSVTIEGNNVTISGTVLRATAGALSIRAAGSIGLSNGAVLQAPGYSQTFGDAFDPQTRAAPGGQLLLSASGTGGISLGDATLSVGNGKGDAGTLKLSASHGAIDWGTVSLDGKGGEGGKGGTFSIDTLGGIDLVGINTRVGADGFTGGFQARTRTGNIELAAGQTLRSGSVNLTADGGFVIVAGTIDTSGVNGGDIELYGTRGVTLQSSALLDSHTNGYAADDTRQARAGNITLGTDFLPGTAVIQPDGSVTGTSGVITVASGARIDASARRPGDRLVRLMRSGVVNYAYVQGDLGGIVTLRAPVVSNSGGQTVNVSVGSASSIIGARSIDLVGFKRWDLAAVANSGSYKGVTYDSATNTVKLDVSVDLDTADIHGGLISVGGVNFLGDNGSGTVVDFVQNLDVSQSYANLGGLATQANFHARPGIDLAAIGDIVLNSNWNLGAGTVDLASAYAAGYVTINPALKVAGVATSGYVVKSGFEGQIFANNTKLIYRTNHGSVRGEAPVLSLRAGGALDLKGSLTDGFFTFRDQSDLTYRRAFGKTYNTDYQLTLNGGFSSGNGVTSLTDWSSWTGTGSPAVYLGLSVASRSSAYLPGSVGTVDTAHVPYTAIGNSPAARGTYSADASGNIDGGGDPLGSAVVFPLLPDGTAVPSSSYIVVAGAAGLAGGSVRDASADPFRINPGSSASLTVEGRSSFLPTAGTVPTSDGVTVAGIKIDDPSTTGGVAFGGTVRTSATNNNEVTFQAWLAAVTDTTKFRGVSDSAVAMLYIGRTNQANDDPNRALILSLFNDFSTQHGLQLNSSDPNVGWRRDSLTATDASTTFIAMSVKNFKLFVTEKLIPVQAQLESNIKAAAAITPAALPTPNATTASGSAGQKTMVRTLVRTGTGSIRLGAAGDLDLTDGPITYVNRSDGQVANVVNADGSIGTKPQNCGIGLDYCTSQLGGVAVYTAGRIAAPISAVLPDPVTGTAVTIATPTPKTSIFASPVPTTVFTYQPGGNSVGSVVADTVNLTDGGDIVVAAQGSVLSRRDLIAETSRYSGSLFAVLPWRGRINLLTGDMDGALATQPWRVVDYGPSSSFGTPQPGGGGAYYASINPQLFREGIGALGGGNVKIDAGGTVSDLTVVSDTSMIRASATPSGGLSTNVLITLGGGNVAVRAGGDILANRIDVASGTLRLDAAGNIGGGAPLAITSTTGFTYTDLDGTTRFQYSVPVRRLNETYVRINDATVDLSAGGDLSIKGIAQLDGFYSPDSALNLLANGSITVSNNIQITSTVSNSAFTIYPGTLNVASLTGSVSLRTYAAPVTFTGVDPTGRPVPPLASYNVGAPAAILMAPSSKGQLSIMAAGDIAAAKIAMLDIDPNFLPGLFTLGGNILVREGGGYITSGNLSYQWDTIGFPSYKSSMTIADLKRLHTNPAPHADDATPVYILAGRDIGNSASGLTLSLPKQARVYAGRDIVNMMFFGQNLADSDLTRIVAGRDIIGTATLAPASYADYTKNPVQFTVRGAQPTMLGNTFVLGGPGNLMVEAGRNLGPFMNSADIFGSSVFTAPPTLRYGGGIITVGNEWNPYLPATSANITVQFGVGRGADYAALRETYVAPGTAANALGDYSTKLIAWMKKNATAELIAGYGTVEVSADDAYAAFIALPELRQRGFLLDEVYFNELRAPADPTSPSYQKFSRGYTAVNTLFPASLGYTANGLEGGAKADMVHTGDLDLRLATIETLYGGNITILGPGGRVLAGSVVATSQQLQRRNFSGGQLFNPGAYPGADIIQAIPPGFEGVLTQRGGFINTFTDGDFLLNQSRLFTVQGGDITMWSSNADLNAGQGAKTTPNFPPVVIRLDEDLHPTADRTAATTGAGIATFPPGKGKKLPSVYLLAPRGTVDAGDAGVRSAGDIHVAALLIANADNFRAAGTTTGVPTYTAPPVSSLTEASNTAGQFAKQIGEPQQNSQSQASIIIVEVLGFGGGEGDDEDPRKKRQQ